MTPETKAKIEAAGEDSSPNPHKQIGYIKGAAYGYNLAVEEMEREKKQTFLVPQAGCFKCGNLHYHSTWNECAEFNRERITTLEARLEKANELLRSMHIDCPAGWNLDNPESVTHEIAIGWHKSNNEKIESYLQNKGG